MRKPSSALSRLMRQVEKTQTCWIWKGRVFEKHGYGEFFLNGSKTTTSRAMWILTKGDPGTSLVCHTCDNKLCVNPEHLFLGSHQTNMDDKVAKNRQSRLFGDKNPSSKLTVEDVRKIRTDLAKGKRQVELAREYGVTQKLISEIKLRRIWREEAQLS